MLRAWRPRGRSDLASGRSTWPLLYAEALALPVIRAQESPVTNTFGSRIERSRLFLMLAPRAGGLISLYHPLQRELLSELCGTLEPALAVVDSQAAATARAILGYLANDAG